MAVGATLAELVEMVRVQTGDSLNPAHSADEDRPIKVLLKMTQERLADEFDWPQLRGRADKPIRMGERYYDWPEGIDPDKVRSVVVRHGDQWLPVSRGITASEYNEYDSDYAPADGYDLAVRSDPVLRWDHINLTGKPQIEVWPIPATDSALRFEGQIKVPSLVEDSDRCVLDDQLIVLHAVAKLLARRADPEASIIAAEAARRLATLRQQATRSNPNIILGGAPPARPRREIVIRSGGNGGSFR